MILSVFVLTQHDLVIPFALSCVKHFFAHYAYHTKCPWHICIVFRLFLYHASFIFSTILLVIYLYTDFFPFTFRCFRSIDANFPPFFSAILLENLQTLVLAFSKPDSVNFKSLSRSRVNFNFRIAPAFYIKKTAKFAVLSKAFSSFSHVTIFS